MVKGWLLWRKLSKWGVGVQWGGRGRATRSPRFLAGPRNDTERDARGAGMTGVGGLEEGGNLVGHEVHLAHEGVVGFDAVSDEVEYEMVEASVQVV